MVVPNKQNKHNTHTHAQCSHASVGLTQARPNYLLLQTGHKYGLVYCNRVIIAQCSTSSHLEFNGQWLQQIAKVLQQAVENHNIDLLCLNQEEGMVRWER